MSLGNENIHQKGEIPEIIKLPNGRLRVVRRFHKFTREDVDDANLGSLMGDFGDLDDANEQIENQGYTNCRLISVEVDTRFNRQSNADNPVLVKTYETLTSSFVQIDDDTESTTESGLKTVTKVFRAVSGTTNNDTVGTSLSGGLTLASSKLVDNDAFAELTQVFSETGVVSVDVDSKYGGVITLTTVTGFNIDVNQAQALSGAAGNFLDQQTKNKGGFETTIFRFVDGSGEIDRSTSEQGVLKKTTITSINEHPDYPNGVLVDQRTDTRDFGIIYTHTYAEGSGTVSEVESLSFNGKLKTTSVTSLGTEPIIPNGAAIIQSATSVENGLTLFKLTHVQGQGEVSSSINPNYGGSLQVETITSINEEPSGSGELIDTNVKAGDGYILYTYQFASGQGEIGRSTDDQYNGKLRITTITTINVEPSGTGALIESKVDTKDGYIVYTYRYATGQGRISRSSTPAYNGVLEFETITSLNEEPQGTGTLTDTQVRSGEGWLLYTYTFVSGSGEIARSTNPEYNGKLTVTTVSSINEAPQNDGALVDTKVEPKDGYVIHTSRFASGQGEIGRVTGSSKLFDTVTISSINQFPSGEDGTIIDSKIEAKDGFFIATVTFAKPKQGPVSSETQAGPIPTSTITRITQVGEEPTGEGSVYSSKVDIVNGIEVFTTEFINVAGGTIASYKDTVVVDVAGKVNCSQEQVQAGDLSGSIAVVNASPASTKRIKAQVEIKIDKTVTGGDGDPAYSLEGLSCSVVSTQATHRIGGGNTVQATSGIFTNTKTGFQQSFSASARTNTFSGCELENRSSSGSVSYTAEERPYVVDNSIEVDEEQSSTTSSCTGTSQGGKYKESGFLKQKVRPILTLADGTTYLEIITWTC
ncbi:MAG: hypothetical protein CMF29_00335 [Kiritimatiellaceae bacterium]|nr:hypothetical protein [Kiritimatiellaceae bacterium]